MKRYTVERSYLTRVTQQYEFETERDLAEWLEEDPGAADEAVCAEGVFISEDFELIDDDELETVIIFTAEVGP